MSADQFANIQDDPRGTHKMLYDRDVIRQKYWDEILEDYDYSQQAISRVTYKGIRTNMKYFTYKVYQVDPLTRENLNANRCYGGDDPLLTVRYGCAPEETVLKCKLPLDEVEQRIKKVHPEWEGYRAGEMYRIVLEVEEHVGIGDKPRNGYGNYDGFFGFAETAIPPTT